MNKLKRAISSLLLVVMVLSGAVVDVSASTAGAMQQRMRQEIESNRTFPTEEMAVDFLVKTFGDGILENEKGKALNTTYYFMFGMLVYGNSGDSSTKYEGTGNIPLSWGQTRDGSDYTNMLHHESVLSGNFQLVTSNEYKNHSVYLTKPFESDLNKPENMGAYYLPNGTRDEQEDIGNRIIEHSMQNIINRLPEYIKTGRGSITSYSEQPSPTENNGDLIKDMESITNRMTGFQITSPPTAYSYGTAVAWFKRPGVNTITHRTFFIDKIKDIDFIADKMNYEEESKKLVVDYTINGYTRFDKEKIHSLLMLGTAEEGAIKQGKVNGLTPLFGNTSGINYLDLVSDELVSYDGRESKRQLTFDLSSVINDFREHEIEVGIAVNSHVDSTVPEIDYTNNIIFGVIPPTKPDLDMKEMDINITETNIEVTGYFELTKGPKTVPMTQVEVIYTPNTGSVVRKTVPFDTIKLDETHEVTVDIPITVPPSGTISIEVNPGKNLTSTDGKHLEESTYENNILEESFGKAFDFSIGAQTVHTELEQDKNFTANLDLYLANSDIPLTTNVTLHKSNGSSAGSKSVSMRSGETGAAQFDLGVLPLGEHTFYGVINSNFNTTTSNPVIGEVDLDNNKIEITVKVSPKLTPPPPGNCSFSGGYVSEELYNLKDRYVPRTCYDSYTNSKGKEVSYSYDCSYYDWGTPRPAVATASSDIKYVNIELRSDSWVRERLALEYNPSAKQALDLKGNPAKDSLMESALGITQLKQILRAGSGASLNATIKITGSTENFDNFSTNSGRIDSYVNDIVAKMRIEGVNVTNNENKQNQLLIPDGTTPKATITSEVSRNYGQVPHRITKYTSNFEVEFKVKPSVATGKILLNNVASSEQPPVPSENKFFTYVDTKNGKSYSIISSLEWNGALLGSSPKGDCISANQTFSIYGTIFDDIQSNPGGNGGGDSGYWDN